MGGEGHSKATVPTVGVKISDKFPDDRRLVIVLEMLPAGEKMSVKLLNEIRRVGKLFVLSSPFSV